MIKDTLQSGLPFILYTWLLFNVSKSSSQTTTTEFPFLEVFTCQDLGFEGSTLNDCGYCVTGTTNLTATFGVDCASTCGKAYVDCAGSCNGMSYIDECSGRCITTSSSGTTEGTGSKIIQKSRDCTGMCSLTEEAEPIQFVKDNCGICIALSEPLLNLTAHNQSIKNLTNEQQNISNVTSQNLTNSNVTSRNLTNSNVTMGRQSNSNSSNSSVLIVSKYKDCSGRCYAPATANMMATNTSDSCYQCIGRNTEIALPDFLDACGNCKSSNVPCFCQNDQKIDMCGVCGGANDTCMTVVSAFPTVLPSQTSTVIAITGVSLKSKYHTVCVFIRQDLEADGKDEEKFSAQVDNTSISCTITLQEGIYDLHLAVEENNKVVIMSNTSVEFIVFSNLASIKSLLPASMVISERQQNFTALFSTQNLRRVKKIYCSITGNAWSMPIQVTSMNITDRGLQCVMPFPLHSSLANITVSLDGKTPVSEQISIKFSAPMPKVTDRYTFPEGESMVIFFNQDIASVNNLSLCADMFTRETLQKLGENATCVWVTKRQLIVTLGHVPKINIVQGANATAVNEVVVLHFLDNVLATENETFAERVKNLSVEFFLSDEIPTAVLVGPNQIPPCGTFTLDGHQSIRIQSRFVRYKWDVAVLTNRTNQTSVPSNGSLARLLQEATLNNLASLVIESALLERYFPYKFTLNVTNGNSSNQSSSATLTVIRQSLNIPMVMIEPSVAHYPGFISVDKKFTLRAYLAMPACQYEFYALSYRWSISNPKVKFDLKQINKESYTVMPYTLPPGENVTFSVKVMMNNDPNMTSESNITFNVTSSKIKMILQGGYQRTTGNSSGTLVLNASQSHHVDFPYLPLVYRWTCVDQDLNPCYSYDPRTNDVLLLANPVSRSSSLSIPTAKLHPGSLLHFIVQSFSPLNATEISESRSVMLHVFSGSAPMVSIDLITVKGSATEKPEFEDIVYLIPPMSDVHITANIHHTISLRTIAWSVPGFIHDLVPFSINYTIRDNLTEATLQIPKDYLVANGIYQINLTATNTNDEEGYAVSSFTILAPVTGCNITIPDYQAFQMVMVRIESCSASQYNHPLSYQVYFYDYKSNLLPLTSAEFHLPIEIMGPPYLSEGNDTSGVNIFAVQVCDVMNSCWWFNSSTVRVSGAVDMHAASEHTFLMANVAKLRGDYLACLRRHSLYLWAIMPSYRIKNEMEVESHIAEALLCARMAADSQCNGSESFGNLFTLLMPIPIDNNPSRDFVLVEVVQKALNRLDHENHTLSASGAQYAVLILEKIYKFNASNTEIAKVVVNLEAIVEKVLARGLHPGQTSILKDSKGQELVAMTYSLLNDTFEVLLQQNINHSVSIELSDSLKERFNAWKCEGENGSVCRGIVAELQFYPENLYRPVKIIENRTVSDVVGVALLNPSTGDKILDESPLTLQLTANYTQMHDNLTYNCYFWDEDMMGWSSNGVDTDTKNKSLFYCKTKRLAIYTIIGTVPTLTAWQIAGIVLGVLAALAIIALIAFLAYRKARTKTMRVSMSKGYHPNVHGTADSTL